MKNSCILYNAGSYGTFVDWCLNYFTGSTDVIPFTATGSSHNFRGKLLKNFADCAEFVKSSKNYPIVRLHPKIDENENLIANLKFVNSHFKKVIYLIPTKFSIAWNINNKFEKIWSEGWINHNESIFLKNLHKWNAKNINDMEIWELREFLSLYLYPQHLAETELEKMPGFQKEFTKFKFVSIEELRDNFKDTIISLLDYSDLNPIRLDEITEIYQKWISYQYHCYKDSIINDIVDSILNNKDYDWSNNKLTLADESLIQYYLRQHKIEIKCWKLNTFPTNTDELRKYLDYPA